MMNPYILLRAASTLFKKAPADLNSQQLTVVKKQAEKEYELEQRVLNSPEAARVIIPAAEIDHTYQEVRSRYQDEAHFQAVLTANHLTIDSLKEALYRQAKVNTVLETIAASAERVNENEVEEYYHRHPNKFNRPEQREVYHILISINPAYPENSRENALQRIQEIQEQLQQDISRFADLALKYSECPTALHGGLLGTVGRGKLYPELEQVLFSMAVGTISDIVESEMGFHLLWCKKIYPTYVMSLAEARLRIYQALQDRARLQKQRQWLASLPSLSTVKEAHHV